MPSSEILAVLADEVTEASDAIRASLADLAVASDATAFNNAASDYLERVRRIAFASEALNLEGLKRVCAFVEFNLAALGIGGLDAERQALFQRWPQLVLGYLKAPRDGVHSRELAEFFQESTWVQPLDETTAQELEHALVTFDEEDADAAPVRESIALPEDVALAIPDDVHPKLIDAFLTEGPLQTGEYSALIQRIVRGDGLVEELGEARRLIHALKGAANTVGVRGVAALCHHVEDILEYLVEGGARPEGELARLLVKVADTLEMMFEALAGTGSAPADAQIVLQAVLDCINRIDRGEIDPAASVDAASGEQTENPSQAVALGTTDAQRTAKAAEQVEPKIRVAVQVIDNLLQSSGEVTVSSGHVRERLQQAYALLAELRERHNALWDRSNDMDAFVTTQGIAAGRRHAVLGGVASTALDPLELDQYNELHTHAQVLTETVADLQLLSGGLAEALAAIDATVHRQALLNNELHQSLMTARMVPAGNLEARLQRAVRQAAEQCAKHVALRVEGTDVMLDDQMVNVLIDPLQHLLRNAVDHGLEPTAIRAQLGKSDTGQIVLGFSRDGNYLMITCRDDGAGLNLTRIHAHAIERGLIAADQTLSDDEIARLILRPGFSTAHTVTEISGRGVGMDIVHTSVAKLKGSIDIRTQTGRGATFALRVPMSLGIVHCLLANAGGQTFALPTDGLAHIVYDGARHLVPHRNGGWLYSDGELNCPAYSLSRLTGLAPQDAIGQGHSRHVVLMNDVAGQIAVVVDGVNSGADLLIKKMGRFLKNVKGVIGASILGNGTVVLILEVSELLRIERGEATAAPPTEAAVSEHVLRPDILVVDDSLSVRTALTALLAEEGFHVRTAKDGIEAIEAIGERVPALVLVDMEMPRMNGLELTAHIRADAAIRHLPIIMVTSRTAEKHRKLASAAGVDDYLTKPYRENELLKRLRTVLSLTKAA